jgi:multidrug efflux pump subunit AcrA (membrane-fusion protein)
MVSWRAVVVRERGALRRLERQVVFSLVAFAGAVSAGAYYAAAASRWSPGAIPSAKASVPRDSRHWESLVLAAATRPGLRWTDPLPAHVRVNEKHTADIGAPVRGRVSRTFVEAGQNVRAGQPLFAIAGPDVVAPLLALREAQLELSAARTASCSLKNSRIASSTPSRF